MKDIRNLLLDCRTALRRADKQFEDSPLADRLGDAIIGISREYEPPPPSEVAVAKPHAQRIAYAWQAAARELRATHPEVHDLLSKRVMERLGEEVLDDAEDEIETLRGHLRLREAANAKLAQELAAAKAAVAVPVAAPPPMAATGAGLPASLDFQPATMDDAKVLGVDDQGVIEAGKRADIIAMPGDPVADIDAVLGVDFVMKDGRVFKRPGVAAP